ncbi:hypothetical protein M409DRAFT_26709 [Zasmidium cellare ATCC 36951]|uniref:Apple domain-containing protein n=1 Tax=Zasmidium cellare ATCC 36951 TaxID=1080233 RepID=A0A6A6C6V8_ZASCE|nr:uncharacterized protein M409DRAFT_26709 [Zasmidium cellare ATCC 36951]KAF2162854.1 hypothetical protein M409DRAFT_26709 [Zasmidium cellare ATCC 36951]
MRTFLLAGLCAVATHAALVDRQASSSCNATSVATVSSGTETETVQEDTYVMWATTTVTVMSMGASPLSTTASPTPSNAKRNIPAQAHLPTQASEERKKRHAAIPGAYSNNNAAAAVKRDLSARAVCATPSTTVTTTLGATTTTVTSTHTLSRYARATVTAPACDASTNYGLFNGTLNRNLYYGYGKTPTFQSYPSLNVSACCAQCFNNADGCVAWSFDGSVNNTDAVPGCVMALYDGGCPTKWGADTIRYENQRKYLVGLGRCNVQVAWFQG